MSRRLEKVAAVLHQQAAAVISRDYNDPSTTLTVTQVDVSPDIKNATIWVSAIGPGSEEMSSRLIKSAPGVIAAAVAQSSSMRSLPHLKINIDTSGEHAERISRLLNTLKQD